MIKHISHYWTNGGAIKNKHGFFLLSIVFLFSLIYSKFLISFSMIGWFLLCLVDISISQHSFSFKTSRSISNSLIGYISASSFWAFSFVLVAMIISGINSEDKSFWLHHLQLKLPFLILPFIFYSARFINQKWVNVFHYILAFVALFVTTHILITYSLDFESINKKISMGQHFPTPVHHVSLSLILAYATVTSLILWRKDQYIPYLKKWMGLVTLILFVFLHIFAVRSGLATCYIALVVYLFYEMLIQKNYKFGLLALMLCIVTPFIAYKTVPSFYNKVGYSLFDWSKWNKGDAVNYSDGGRILSYRLGIDLFITNPPLGSGIGDIRNDSEQWYKDNVTGYTGKLNYPHNQILFLLAACGLVGTLLYLFALLFPFFSQKLYSDPFALVLYTIIFSSFLVESTLEHSYTIGFFLFFALIVLRARIED